MEATDTIIVEFNGERSMCSIEDVINEFVEMGGCSVDDFKKLVEKYNNSALNDCDEFYIIRVVELMINYIRMMKYIKNGEWGHIEKMAKKINKSVIDKCINDGFNFMMKTDIKIKENRDVMFGKIIGNVVSNDEDNLIRALLMVEFEKQFMGQGVLENGIEFKKFMDFVGIHIGVLRDVGIFERIIKKVLFDAVVGLNFLNAMLEYCNVEKFGKV